MLSFVFFIVHFASLNAELRREYSPDVYRVIFGDVASMEDLFQEAEEIFKSNPQEQEETIRENVKKKHEQNETFSLDPDEKESFDMGYDAAAREYYKLSNEVKTMRRFYRDPADLAAGYTNLEPLKERKMKAILLQFLLHTRHEVGTALRQREPIIKDKRYKIGYLFNRVRRIKTEELKLLWTLYKRREQSHRTTVRQPLLYALLMYEKMAAYDVDLRDTCSYIKQIFAVKEPFDYYTSTIGLRKLTPKPKS